MTYPTYPHGGPGSFVLVGHRVLTPTGLVATVTAVYGARVRVRFVKGDQSAEYHPSQLCQIPQRPPMRAVAA